MKRMEKMFRVSTFFVDMFHISQHITAYIRYVGFGIQKLWRNVNDIYIQNLVGGNLL